VLAGLSSTLETGLELAAACGDHQNTDVGLGGASNLHTR
jgi:hypothetical protein